MRQFGKDAPDFFVFQIEESEETYKIPLAASMTNRGLMAFNATGDDYCAQCEWLRGYIGDVVDDLTPNQTNGIILAWIEESKGQGADPGES